MQVLYLSRAHRTKETLLDFLKWRRITRHPLVFRGLTGSQRTLGFGASQLYMFIVFISLYHVYIYKFTFNQLPAISYFTK